MIIALTTGPSKTQHFLNKVYSDFVKRAGFEPILVSPECTPDVVAEIADGLLLPGGIDIDPTYYGTENLNSYSADADRDAYERAVLHAFIVAGKPSFGICRGFQLMVQELMHIQHGVYADLCRFAQHVDHHALADGRSIPRTSFSHKVQAKGQLHGNDHGAVEDMFVNSMHHQALMTRRNLMNPEENPDGMLGGMEVLAISNFGVPIKKNKAQQEVIIEAVGFELGGARLRGVQWHPEELSQKDDRDLDLIRTFFAPAENGDQANEAG